QQSRTLDRLAHDNPLREGDAGERAELRVAAFDQLAERRRAEARADCALPRRGELAAMTVERGALAVVVRRDVDEERRRRGVVDEVVADPVGGPRAGRRLESTQAALERRQPQRLARRDVIGMAVVPVGNGDRARTMAADEI